MTNNITHSFLTPQQKFRLSGNCGIQCHILWDLGEASALHTDLDPDYGHCSGLEPAVNHGQESRCGSTQRFPAKRFQHTVWGVGGKVQVMCTGEGKRNSLILLTSSLPQSDTTQGQERPSWLRISPTGQRFRDRVNM